MARGDPPASLECMGDYFNGSRFALVAIRNLHWDDLELRAELTRYIEIIKRYGEATQAVIELHRSSARARSAATGSTEGPGSSLDAGSPRPGRH